MPQYEGHNEQVTMPVFPRSTPRSTSSGTLSSWWNTLSQAANQDIHIAQDLNTSETALYEYNDAGRLVPALSDGQIPPTPEVQQHLLDLSRDGRLFIRPTGNSEPRQVYTHGMNDNIAITTPVRELPQSDVPAEPTRPSIFKRLIHAIFGGYKDDIQSYATDKAAYDQAKAKADWLGHFKDGQAIQELVDANIIELAGSNKDAVNKVLQDRVAEVSRANRERQEQERAAQQLKTGATARYQEIEQFQNARKDIPSAAFGFAMNMKEFSPLASPYTSYEDALDQIGKGDKRYKIQNRVVSQYNELTPDQKDQLLVDVIKRNNQLINKYTPDQLQFRWIAEMNHSIIHMMDFSYSSGLKDRLMSKGLTQEDINIAQGVVIADHLYEKNLSAQQMIMRGLKQSTPALYSSIGAETLLGEMVHNMAAAHNVKCVDGQNPPNPFYAQLGAAREKSKQDSSSLTDSIYNYGDNLCFRLTSSIQKSDAFKAYEKEPKNLLEALSRYSNPVQLRKDCLRVIPENLQDSLGGNQKNPNQLTNTKQNSSEGVVKADDTATKNETGGFAYK